MSQIVLAPNAVLRQPAKQVPRLDKRILSIIEDMKSTLVSAKDPEGVGLAAPQIGISLQIFLTRLTKKSKPIIFINPEITKFSQRLQEPESNKGVYEGCLSIPDHYAPVKRSMSVTIRYQTPQLVAGNWQLVTKTEVLTGFAAHIVQHEVDHLNGILFIDRVLEQNTKLYHIQDKTWEEVSL